MKTHSTIFILFTTLFVNTKTATYQAIIKTNQACHKIVSLIASSRHFTKIKRFLFNCSKPSYPARKQATQILFKEIFKKRPRFLQHYRKYNKFSQGKL